MKKAAYFSNTDFSLYNFRLALMSSLKKKGYHVFACATTTDRDYKKKLEENFSFKNIPLKRNVDFLGRDIIYLFRVFLFCKKEKPSLCHNFTIKPCIFASLGQRLAGQKNIYCTITGLGSAFDKSGFLKKLITFLYRMSFKEVKKVTFQNPEDRDLFLDLNIIKKEKTEVIKGSGVDTSFFAKENICEETLKELKKEINYNSDKIYITLIARMLYSKGVADFAKAGEKLKEKNLSIELLLVGPIDEENPSRIKEEEIKKWESLGVLKYLGQKGSVKEILYLSDIFTLPSFYKEGIPKALLEAGSMSLPLVTTDVPGCREVVDDGVNGFLVKSKNSKDLSEKIELLVNLNKEERDKMGEKSREKIINNFSEEKIIREILNVYDLI